MPRISSKISWDEEGTKATLFWFSQLAMLASSVIPAIAVGQSQAGVDSFQLFTRCAPIGVEFSVAGDPPIPGLAQEAVERAVTSRLRSARIYKTVVEAPGFLSVRVNSYQRAFGVDVEFQKVLRDEFTGVEGSATTWRSGGVGTYGNDGQFVRGVLAEKMDEFIDEYLRVNGAWCRN